MPSLSESMGILPLWWCLQNQYWIYFTCILTCSWSFNITNHSGMLGDISTAIIITKLHYNYEPLYSITSTLSHILSSNRIEWNRIYFIDKKRSIQIHVSMLWPYVSSSIVLLTSTLSKALSQSIVLHTSKLSKAQLESCRLLLLPILVA